MGTVGVVGSFMVDECDADDIDENDDDEHPLCLDTCCPPAAGTMAINSEVRRRDGMVPKHLF